jgi:hypothetical protein
MQQASSTQALVCWVYASPSVLGLRKPLCVGDIKSVASVAVLIRWPSTYTHTHTHIYIYVYSVLFLNSKNMNIYIYIYICIHMKMYIYAYVYLRVHKSPFFVNLAHVSLALRTLETYALL